MATLVLAILGLSPTKGQVFTVNPTTDDLYVYSLDGQLMNAISMSAYGITGAHSLALVGNNLYIAGQSSIVDSYNITTGAITKGVCSVSGSATIQYLAPQWGTGLATAPIFMEVATGGTVELYEYYTSTGVFDNVGTEFDGSSTKVSYSGTPGKCCDADGMWCYTASATGGIKCMDVSGTVDGSYAGNIGTDIGSAGLFSSYVAYGNTVYELSSTLALISSNYITAPSGQTFSVMSVDGLNKYIYLMSNTGALYQYQVGNNSQGVPLVPALTATLASSSSMAAGATDMAISYSTGVYLNTPPAGTLTASVPIIKTGASVTLTWTLN